ncbi:MAG: GTP-binding protein [Pseudomonadota bacterium]
MAKNPAQRIPVSVLTGFLGSGKTTILNQLVQQPDFSKTLVLINEFGEIGLDHDLMVRSQDDVVVEMASGCLCCTIRGDLAKTLRDAPGRFARGGKLWFDRVLIETTGLADPAPIMHTLMTDEAISERYQLNSIITTVDAVNGGDTLDMQFESVKQAAVADRLIITKTDLTDSRTVSDLQARLLELNPRAVQITVGTDDIDPTALFESAIYDPATKSLDVAAWLKTEAYPPAHSHDHIHHHDHHDHAHHHDVNRHDELIKAVCLTIDEPIPGAAFDAWLSALLVFRGADLLRVKGIVNIAESDKPMVFHGVQHIFHPPLILDAWPSDDRRSRIVFITRGIDENLLRSTLKTFADVKGASLADAPAPHTTP